MKRLVVVLVLCAGCSRPPNIGEPDKPTHDATDALLAALGQQESALRASTDWATLPSSDRTLGPDPIDIVAVGPHRFLGALRGADAVVLIDGSGRELARTAGPRAPRQIARVSATVANVVGEQASSMWRVEIDGTSLTSARAVDHRDWLPPSIIHGLRGVTGWGQVLTDNGAILTAASPFTLLGLDVVATTEDALLLKTAGRFIATMSPLAHTISVFPLSFSSRFTPSSARRVEISSDGPPWGFALMASDDDVLVAVGGVEDHALDRSIGSFGYVDSFLRVLRVNKQGEGVKLLELNLSDIGVVLPKALAFIDDDTVLVAGCGSGRAARVHVSSFTHEMVPSLPGVVALVPTAEGFIGASPLLDAWIVVDNNGARAVPVPSLPSSRSVESKLGEAVAFTTIMAPRQKSDGALSRFTCETCHFEGGIDGRVHATGRGDIVATTRPLFGLFNNKPLFTRALDANLSQMVHAEFRVANANSTLDPWFALTPADAPWLSLLGVQGTQAPIDLRRALVAFLHDFTPRTNARVVGKTAFNDDEKKGTHVFRAHCVSCHAARLIGDDAKSEQPFERWQSLVLADNGPLVWSSDGKRKTGIKPYVHEDGARPSSLRRIFVKRPYFTNGSSKTLNDLVARVRFDDATFAHASERADLEQLSEAEQRALVAFLQLL